VFILSAAAAKSKEKVETNKKVRSSDKELNYYYLPVRVLAVASCTFPNMQCYILHIIVAVNLEGK
jgi:hypothetical protein